MATIDLLQIELNAQGQAHRVVVRGPIVSHRKLSDFYYRRPLASILMYLFFLSSLRNHSRDYWCEFDGTTSASENSCP